MTNGSSHSRWESNVHACEKPYVSAFLHRSMTRAAGGSVWRTTPKSISDSGPCATRASVASTVRA